MANASIDSNGARTLIAVLNTNGSTIVRVKVNATGHGLKTSDGTTGSDNGGVNAFRDENDGATLMGVASRTVTSNGVDYVQGVTPVVIYADSSGNLLVDSN